MKNGKHHWVPSAFLFGLPFMVMFNPAVTDTLVLQIINSVFSYGGALFASLGCLTLIKRIDNLEAEIERLTSEGKPK
jgi:hypothetical protein